MSTAPPPAEAAAAAEPAAVYHGLLEDAGLAEASVEHLRAGQQRRGLRFGDRPLSVALRPNLLSRRRYRESVAAATAVRAALDRLERALLADAGLRAQLDLAPEEERLALADPGCRSSSPSARLDSFFGERVRYVEYNAESPAGMAYEDTLADVFAGLPVMRAFRLRYRLRAMPVRRRQLASLLRAFHEWGRADAPVIA